jgi:DNA-binding CsgD family transcriptional regulator
MSGPTKLQLDVLAALANHALVSDGDVHVRRVADNLGVGYEAVNAVFSRLLQLMPETYDNSPEGESRSVYLVYADKAVELGWLELVRDYYYVSSSHKYLTGRQRQMLILMARGFSFAEIGREAGISLETVKSHMIKLRACIGASNSPHAVALGFSLGIIIPDDLTD